MRYMRGMMGTRSLEIRSQVVQWADMSIRLNESSCWGRNFPCPQFTLSVTLIVQPFGITDKGSLSINNVWDHVCTPCRMYLRTGIDISLVSGVTDPALRYNLERLCHLVLKLGFAFFKSAELDKNGGRKC